MIIAEAKECKIVMLQRILEKIKDFYLEYAGRGSLYQSSGGEQVTKSVDV